MSKISKQDYIKMVGTILPPSKWIIVNQDKINHFAEATEDHQFIHIDEARAKAETSFGGTIAHGFLSLSLLSPLAFDILPKLENKTMGINYGFEKIRFLNPVKSGARVRANFKLVNVIEKSSTTLQSTYDVSVEIENEEKPALIATWQVMTVLNS
jgi:acyl dehydratase